MCGIAGIINFDGSPVEEKGLLGMMESIKHRGPDDEGTFFGENFGLGHVRLSIIDLSPAGHQPMFCTNDRFVITFNGEIYNYIELRKELENEYQFRTKTDTEVILAAYQTWGTNCLDRFNGDFAFVIYDRINNEFFGARDRFGIKPLYYYLDNKKLVFASEIKAIIPVLPYCKPNEKLIFEYLIYNRTDQYLETFFEGIKKLKHGHFFQIKDGEFSIHQWYNLSEKINSNDMSPAQYRSELRSSINLRLRSDVPLGVSLSGGIDSSVITSIISKDFGLDKINTFSAVYGKEIWADESQFIDEYKKELSNMHFTFPSAETFFKDFKSFIKAQCEPVASVGPYGQYKVMELAKGNVVVTLDGQGADEMLAGYHNFFGAYFKELFEGLKLKEFLIESFHYIKKHKSLNSFKYFGFYFLPSGIKNSISSRINGSVSKEFFNKMKGVSTIDKDLYAPRTLNESLLQHFEFKLEHLLKWDDLNSMAFSIESRVPFLDHNLVEKTLSLPPGRKIHLATTKYILRESVKDILPKKIYNRSDKKGFTTPSDIWFRDDKFQKYILEMLNSEKFKKLGYFDVEDCKRKYNLHLEQKSVHTVDIWKWINIYVWFEEFIDKKIN
jgi:asparagine synthase (glutamine-hydrolysing)